MCMCICASVCAVCAYKLWKNKLIHRYINFQILKCVGFPVFTKKNVDVLARKIRHESGIFKKNNSSDDSRCCQSHQMIRSLYVVYIQLPYFTERLLSRQTQIMERLNKEINAK